MRQPIVYTASMLRNWDVDCCTKAGRWVPARPMGHNLFSFWYRITTAWSVLIGKYDAVLWECDYE